jgi:ParB-like chromosome segregation protein Spo0J
MLEGVDLEILVEDIKANDLHYPIVVFGDPRQILDGKNRYRACLEAGVEGRWQEFIGTKEQAEAFVRSRNFIRRHDNEYSRAKAALKMVTTTHGGDRGNQHAGGKPSNLRLGEVTVKQAALIGGMSKTAIEQTQRVDRESTHPVIVRAAALGVVKLYKADELARMAEDDQDAEVERWVRKAVKNAETTPEQRQRAIQTRRLKPKTRRDANLLQNSRIATAIKTSSWEEREFGFKMLWEMFGAALRNRMLEEVIAPSQQKRYGLGADPSPEPESDESEGQG